MQMRPHYELPEAAEDRFLPSERKQQFEGMKTETHNVKMSPAVWC